MKAMTKFLAGTAGLAAAAAFATPASAQYYPGQPYGGYGYGYGQPYGGGAGAIGQILNSIINPYGQTGYYNYGGEQRQVEICVQAVNQRVASMGYGYNNYGGRYGYNQPYGGYGQAQVASVDMVERHNDGVKVRGTAWSNNRTPYSPYGGYNRSYGGWGGYNARGGDIAFSCRITSRMQIRDINLYDRRTGRQIG